MKIDRLTVNIARRRLREKFGRDGFRIEDEGVISIRDSAGTWEKVGHIEGGFAFLPGWRVSLKEGRPVNVYLDRTTREKALRIGGGSLSAGIRLAVQNARE
jgi:hypothetical protein